MTTLQFFTGLSTLWIAMLWIPYILDRIAVRGLAGAMANHSPDAKPQSPWAQRAMRAHTVAVESFVTFAPAAFLAMMLRPEDAYPGVLAGAYFFAMVAHYVIYTLGIPMLRTVAFAIAALSTIALALRALGFI